MTIAPTTPASIISRALKKAGILGVGQEAQAEDVNDAFDDLNDMLAQWARMRWLVYHLIDVSKVSTGAVSYTVGAGGDFNTPRPNRLEDGCFFRQLQGAQQIDYPLQLIQAREDYNQIVLKNMGTWPSVIFYDSGYPLGSVYVWPVPAASAYSIHLLLKQPLNAFTSLTQTIVLPPEYNQALWSNLALILRVSYQLPPLPDGPGSVTSIARASLNVIRGANTQVATLGMPAAVMNRRWGYNVYSDT